MLFISICAKHILFIFYFQIIPLKYPHKCPIIGLYLYYIYKCIISSREVRQRANKKQRIKSLFQTEKLI